MDLFLMDYYISSIHLLFDNDYEGPINKIFREMNEKFNKIIEDLDKQNIEYEIKRKNIKKMGELIKVEQKLKNPYKV